MSRLFCILLLMLPQLLFADWKYEQQGSPMDDEIMHIAVIRSVEPMRPIGRAYANLNVDLAYHCTEGTQGVSLLFNRTINSTNSEAHDGFNRIRGRTRWGDDDATSFVGTQTWGSRQLSFSGGMSGRLQRYNRVLFEIQWHGIGDVIFEFDLTGADEAIKKAKEACGRL